jgi:hypothetical protein
MPSSRMIQESLRDNGSAKVITSWVNFGRGILCHNLTVHLHFSQHVHPPQIRIQGVSHCPHVLPASCCNLAKRVSPTPPLHCLMVLNYFL